MQTIINGMKTNYVQKGEQGDCIILLHGWGSNIGVFNQTIDFLSEKHVVYALDMPGCGMTDEPPEPLDATGYASFVNQFADKLGIKKASLIGHSNGGRTIIKLSTWEKRTFEIDKIVLIDSAGIKNKPTLTTAIKTKCFKISKSILASKPIQKLFPQAVDNLKSKCGSEDYRNASDIMKKCMVKLINEDLTPLLKNIKYPTLLVWGSEDTATPLSDGQLMSKLIPDAGLVTLKGAGHYSFLQQPFIYLNVLNSFFNGRR